MNKKLLEIDDRDCERYIDVNGTYSSIIFGDILKSVGNPLIGHKINQKINKFSKKYCYSIPKDVYFRDFIQPFLNLKSESLIYDRTPLQNLYNNLNELEKSKKIEKEIIESLCEIAREPTTFEFFEFNMPTIHEKRIQRLKAGYDHTVVKNAIRILEKKFHQYL